MMKRLIGVLAAAGILTVLVFTAFDRSVDSVDSSGTADRPDTVQSADSLQ